MTIFLLLAAGAAHRMGEPKQLLDIFGMPLIVYMIEKMRSASQNEPIFVVLGAHIDKILPLISTDKKLYIVYNERWVQGMGTSISQGIQAILKEYPQAQSILILVVDQPFITPLHLKNLILKQKNTQKNIIATQYADIIGVPAFFDQNFFPQLLQLSGEQGARKIIVENKKSLATVPFEAAIFDLDTPDDYQVFLKSFKI